MIKSWQSLPENMRTPQVRPYYERLTGKKFSLGIKRGMDIFLALILTVILAPVMGVLAIWIRLDSPGPVIYRQERITQYGRAFQICKFRTMVEHADREGPLVTAKEDTRITRVGEKLRKLRLDELPQLFNILAGQMSFVGTRPEVKKYVEQYTPKMMATLLLPAGITSYTSIKFRDEDELIASYKEQGELSADEIYVRFILPKKMEYNLKYLKKFSVMGDLRIMIETAFAVLR